MLTDDEVKAIEGRAKAATPRPWDVAPLEDDGRPSGWRVKGPEYDSPRKNPRQPGRGASYHDAAFIAAARTDVPALLADRRELLALVRELASTRQDGDLWRHLMARCRAAGLLEADRG